MRKAGQRGGSLSSPRGLTGAQPGYQGSPALPTVCVAERLSEGLSRVGPLLSSEDHLKASPPPEHPASQEWGLIQEKCSPAFRTALVPETRFQAQLCRALLCELKHVTFASRAPASAL